jgi:hypothetical protein
MNDLMRVELRRLRNELIMIMMMIRKEMKWYGHSSTKHCNGWMGMRNELVQKINQKCWGEYMNDW